MYTALKEVIENAWDNRETLKETETQTAIGQIIELLDKGRLRTAEPASSGWQINEWVKIGNHYHRTF